MWDSRYLLAAIFLFFPGSAFAQSDWSPCMAHDCDVEHDPFDLLLRMSEQQIQLNELLSGRDSMPWALDPDEDDHRECVRSCRVIAEQRQDNCNQVHRPSLPIGDTYEDLNRCLAAVQEGHRQCLSTGLLDCQ